jgi:penicillin-binding protein 2
MAAHVLGYLGEVSDAELATQAFAGYNPGDQTGRTGLERAYNKELRGTDGFKRVVVNTMGKEMSQLERKPFVAGKDLVTTLDLDLQRVAEEGVGARTGAVVALDPRTGDILAIVSKPAFDPNVFATRISNKEWSALNGDPRKPLQNRAIQNAYAPGSVFKIFEAAAALDAGMLDPLETVYCSGSATFGGHTYGCWKREGHGRVGLYEAIVHSCDVYFYNLGKTMGISRISQFSTLMGFGRRSGIDLSGEVTGLVPSEEWSWRVRKAKWYAGETISLAIGQGAIGVTPLQAAWAMGGVASGGRLMLPRLVNSETLEAFGRPAPEPGFETYPMSQSAVDIVSKAMWGVVNEGTGTAAKVPGFDVAGKTGTAQVVGKEHYAKGTQYEDHAWFVGFAPYRNPEIVVAVFIEHGGHGGDAAAPVAKSVFEEYYKKRNADTGEKTPAIASLSH